MANEKFEPTENISDIEIRLECLRLATEFSPENERREPLEKATKKKQVQAYKHKGFWQCMDHKIDKDMLDEMSNKKIPIWLK